jgi:hypothetical protein
MITKKEIFAHLLDLKSCAERNNWHEFHHLALKILIPYSPELEQLYCLTPGKGITKKDRLKKNFNRRAEGMEELIRISFECFKTGECNPIFDYLPKLGI